jgi:hypothetical protein
MMPNLPIRRARVLRGLLLSATGLLIGLGFLSLEANHHTHWHSTGGVARAHDHVAVGPHRHDAAEEPGKDGEDQQPTEPVGESRYLGQASFPFLDRVEPAYQGALEPLGRQYAEVSLAPLQPSRLSSASPRGPPPVRR